MNKIQNWSLVLGGILSFFAGLLHIAIIMGGADWYRFFGAGEELALMVEKGSWYPAVLTFAISIVLFLWGVYALSGANIVRKLPFLKVALILISLVYLFRGIAVVPIYFIQPEMVDQFLVWSSAICLVYGGLYSIGTAKAWHRLA